MSIKNNFALVLVLLYCTLPVVGKVHSIFSTNQKPKKSQLRLGRMLFPTLDVGHMYLL